MHKMLSGSVDVETDIVSYCMTVEACVRAGHPLRAEAWFLQMEAALLRPTLSCCSTLLRGLGKLGDIPRFVNIGKRIEDAKHDLNTTMYNTSINACARHADTDRAEEWLKSMVAH